MRLIDAGRDPGDVLDLDAIPLDDEATYAMPVADVVDLSQERQRLNKELVKVKADLDKIDKKLANQQFLKRAPVEVVEEQRLRRLDIEQAREQLHAALARIAD